MGLVQAGQEIPRSAMMPLATSFARTGRRTAIVLSRHLLILSAIFLFPAVLAPNASGTRPHPLRLIPDSLISLASEDGPAYAILVEIETQNISLYQFKEVFILRHRFPCSTGEVPGQKQRSGDLKTPVGIYFFTKAFPERDLAPVYGSRAFVMDYPNFIDRKLKRGGDSIWLHGSDKPIKARDSNGCIVMNNDDLEVLAGYVQLNRTPLVVVQKLSMVPVESQYSAKKSLTGFLNDWKEATVNEDWARFRDCYGKPHGDPDALTRAWERIGAARRRAQASFEMDLRNITLLKGTFGVIALFDQVIQLDRRVTAVGTKKLFLERQEKTWKIIREEYQPCVEDHGTNTPLVTALNHADHLFIHRRALAELVSEWVDAWSSKDMEQYRGFYASDFQAGGRDLETWIRDKQRLNRDYGTIKVSVEGLKIVLGPHTSTLTFLQRYRANGYNDVGIKRLKLKHIGGKWKIHRETWDRLHS